MVASSDSDADCWLVALLVVGAAGVEVKAGTMGELSSTRLSDKDLLRTGFVI